MNESQFSQKMSKIAGIATWLAVGVPEIIDFTISSKFFIWLAAYLLFIIIFSFYTAKIFQKIFKNKFVVLSALTALATITQILNADYGLMPILFVLTAVIAAYFMPVKMGFYWVIFQSLIIFTSLITIGVELFNSFVPTIAYFGFQAFALFSTYAMLNEVKAKMELAQVNAELRATQELIKESGQMTERLRIARELHDLIGHQLTALSLNLEVAKHLSDAKAKEHIIKAQLMNKILLSDLRKVVSSMLDTEEIDLVKVLNGLIENVPKPKIHFDISEDLIVRDPNRAHVIVRCVQEVITNSIKHSNAENLWFSIEIKNYNINIKARDDGRGAQGVKAGNGLTGMAERLAEVGGKLSFASQQGQGFNIEASLPVGF